MNCVAHPIEALHPDSARTLERVKLEARIKESEYIQAHECGSGTFTMLTQRIASLKAQLAALEKQGG